MHPQEFVVKMISRGRAAELAEIVRQSACEYQDRMQEGHEAAYNFVNMFLISVAGQLKQLKIGETLEDDDFLRVWRSLGLWGLKREQIADYLESSETE